MAKVYNKETGEFLGRISREELEFLAKQLEEEGLKDRDYYIRRETVENFAGLGASPHLLDVLRGGLRDREAVEVRWEDEAAQE